MEKDFEEKCELELKNLQASLVIHEAKVDSGPKDQDQPPIEQNTEAKEMPTKVSKSNKRREKKEKNNERMQSIVNQEEIDNKSGPAFLELKKITEKLEKKSLQIKDVNSDGNCMYYAISDQLLDKMKLSKSYQQLRQLASEYMLRNPDEFQPYLCDESSGDSLDDEQYKEYCRKVQETLAWGGQLELKALSDTLKVIIEVVQADGSDILIGDADKFHNKLIISYHRRMFGSGEHYNSTCEKTQTESDGKF